MRYNSESAGALVSKLIYKSVPGFRSGSRLLCPNNARPRGSVFVVASESSSSTGSILGSSLVASAVSSFSVSSPEVAAVASPEAGDEVSSVTGVASN